MGFDEAPLGISQRAEGVPLRPEQGLDEEGIQQGALTVTLPDASLHVDRLLEPVCGGDAQPGHRVEE